jgi:hypothetical protein
MDQDITSSAEAMSSLLTALLNTAGTGVLAYVLWLLLNRSNDQFAKATELFGKVHSEIINTFKSEQKAEREMCDRHFQQLSDAISRNQEVLIKTTHVLDQQANATEHQMKLLQDHHNLALKIAEKVSERNS